jgi:lipase ATG15
MFNEKYSAFKVLDILPLVFSIIIWLVYFITMLIFYYSDSFFVNAKEKINQEREFQLTDWKRNYFSEERNIENAICFTNIHGLSLFKISSLAFASYINDTENTIEYYKKSFFKENIETITQMKFLDLNSKYSVVLMINIDIPDQKPLTVFSIQASIKKLDYWLDFEIFSSSALFTIIRLITINKLESLTSKAITWLLTIPIRLLEKFTLFSKYLESFKYIDEEIKKINGERNIIFTGHSLGGGMAKYLGLKYHKENVAVSGPGITPLEYKFTKEDNYYKYFKSNLIDIVPDNDIVPRIETSGGVRYRVLCEKGYFSCHQIERIICQIGATCGREDLSGDVCISIFGKKDYEDIRNLAGLKNSIPEDYN